MLSFEQKKSIFKGLGLQEKPMSNNRISFIYPDSKQRGKVIVTQLYPSGNGYVLGKYMDLETIKAKGYTVDKSGWIHIKDFSNDELMDVTIIAMESMSGKHIDKITMSNKDSSKQQMIEKQDDRITSSFSEGLIRSCLYNWLGYGNINAPIWFLGTEEGGAEIWRNRTVTLEKSLSIRSKFNVSMDFQYVWEDLYKIPLESFKGATVWRYIVAFLLEWEGKNSNRDSINDYLFKEKLLGRKDSNHFLGEAMPLPKRSKDCIKDYSFIWNSLKDYYNEVLPKRFSLITKALIDHSNVKLVVSYDRTLTKSVVDYFSNLQEVDSWEFQQKKYKLYKIPLSDKRQIYFLSTPFFGNGQISYDGLRNAVQRVKAQIEFVAT